MKNTAWGSEYMKKRDFAVTNHDKVSLLTCNAGFLQNRTDDKANTEHRASYSLYHRIIYHMNTGFSRTF